MSVVWKWEQKHPAHPFCPQGVSVHKRLGWEESVTSLRETEGRKEIDWEDEEAWRHKGGI